MDKKSLKITTDKLKEVAESCSALNDSTGTAIVVQSHIILLAVTVLEEGVAQLKRIVKAQEWAVEQVEPTDFDTPAPCACDSLRTAVEFYANRINYNEDYAPGNMVGTTDDDRWENDEGDIAREALAASPKPAPDATVETSLDAMLPSAIWKYLKTNHVDYLRSELGEAWESKDKIARADALATAVNNHLIANDAKHIGRLTAGEMEPLREALQAYRQQAQGEADE